jgi:glucokinase
VSNQPGWIGIDLGGTSIKAGRTDSSGDSRVRRQIETQVNEGGPSVMLRIANLAREFGQVDSLGIGVPGLVDSERGLVTHSPNLAPMEGYPLRLELARELGIAESSVQLENDACVAALGEHWVGAARGLENVLMVTLGTGIGGGLILGGELFRGSTGRAAEIGHITVEPGGRKCGCGNLGCLEALASARSASSRAASAGLPRDLEKLADRARAGDSACQSFLNGIGLDLGRGLGAILMLLDLDAFLVGGGFGAALDLMKSGVEDGILERSYGRQREELRILPAELGPDAGWIGAARLGANASA